MFATDGHGGITDSVGDTVTVANTPPTAGTVAISPASPGSEDTITATPSAFTDADGDTLTYHYRWSRNATMIEGETADTLKLSTPGNGDAGDTITVQLSASDGCGATTADAATDTVRVDNTVRLVDTTSGDFAGGTASDTMVGGTGSDTGPGADGEIALTPAVGEEFEGAALPAGWAATPWDTATPPAGGAVVADGALTVDGAASGLRATFAPGRSLEFVAVFSGAPYQHVGLATDFNAPPWAMFSTKDGTGLYARSSGTGQQDTPIAGVSATMPHRYRIEWTATGVDYFVDATRVASHAVAIGDELRPLASDLTVGGGSVSVQWLRLSPYATTGTFTSRVLDAATTADWQSLDPATVTPTGTRVTFETRSSRDAAAPDGSWSGWRPVGSQGTIESPDGRYLQYRATLSTDDTTLTPTVQRVTVNLLTVTNSAPTAGTATITPAAPATADTVTATPSAFTDADGDQLTYHYRWLVNDEAVDGATGETLDLSGPGHGDRGDEVRVEITASNGHGAVSDVAGGGVTVVNSAPTAGTVTISPSSPTASATLTATPNRFGDIDGDPLTYAYTWLRNDHEIVGERASTLKLTGAGASDVIRVEVRARDGHGGASDTASGEVTVASVPSDPAKLPAATTSEASAATSADAVVPPVAQQQPAGNRGPRQVRLPRQQTLRGLAVRGLCIELLAPQDTGVLHVRLYRASTVRTPGGQTATRLTRTLAGKVKVRRGGRVIAHWNLTRRDVARLHSGRYVLIVRCGPDSSHLSSRTARATIRLTGKPISHARGRRLRR